METDPLASEVREARTVTADGDVLLLVPAGSPAARAGNRARGDDVTAVLEITDVAPVSVPHRIRGRAWVAGWLTATQQRKTAGWTGLDGLTHPDGMGSVTSWTALRLEVGETCVDDLWGTETVEPEDFTVAAPDPLAQHETELLQHLASSHDSHLRTLSRLLGDERQSLCALHDVELDESLAHDACWSAVPLALDRFGMRVRFVTGGSAVFDARFEFPDPVRDVAELRLAMRRLFDAAEA